MQEGLQTRFTIHQILRELKTSNLSFDEVFEKKIKNKGFSISDKRFIYTVVLNAMRNYIYIDKIISKFSKKRKELNDTYFLLLSAVTQLLILDFKDFAVVNSTVELVKEKKVRAPANFINGILRNIIRNKYNLLKIPIEFMHLPSWFKKRVFWHEKQKEDFLNTIRKEPNLHLVFKNKKNINNIDYKFIKTTKHSIAIKNRNLIEKTESYLLRTPNFGRKSLREVRNVLKEMNLSLGMNLGEDWPPENIEEYKKHYQLDSLDVASAKYVPINQIGANTQTQPVTVKKKT